MQTIRLIKDFIDAYPEDIGTRKAMEIGQTIRKQGFAKMEQLLVLGKWKFPISIAHVNIPNNSEDHVEVLTGLVLKNSLSDSQRIRILMGLTGVKVRMASAILTLIFPELFGTFDTNARYGLESLELINRNELSNYKLQDYLEYLKLLRRIAEDMNCSPRDVDRALYYYGKHLKKRCLVDGNCPICLKLKV